MSFSFPSPERLFADVIPPRTAVRVKDKCRTGVCHPGRRLGTVPARNTCSSWEALDGRHHAHRPPAPRSSRSSRRTMRERGYPPSVREIGEAVGPHVAVHRARPPRHAPAARLPAPRPHQAPGHRGALRPARRAPRSSAGRSATCPLVGDVAAGTDVLAQENVEELLPLPADFTGEGELFMLRVRGDSMIDAGILDGDFVVARRSRRPTTATSSWPASPATRPPSRPTRARATRSSLVPANAAPRADGVRPGRGHGLRQGRHRPAPPLSDRA